MRSGNRKGSETGVISGSLLRVHEEDQGNWLGWLCASEKEGEAMRLSAKAKCTSLRRSFGIIQDLEPTTWAVELVVFYYYICSRFLQKGIVAGSRFVCVQTIVFSFLLPFNECLYYCFGMESIVPR